ncbi:MAG TPA: ubiquinol-cytochrome c reductase iron-sulfur subunit [Gemmatimonadaceae bacterium]
MACSDCINRRDFLISSAAATAGALVMAGCGNGQFGPTGLKDAGPGGIPTDGPKLVKVGDFPDLATTGLLVQVADLRAAKRLTATTFAAYSLICTHQQCAAGVQNGTQIVCPCHGSRFDANGNVVNGPATRPLPTLTTSYDPATDILTVQ